MENQEKMSGNPVRQTIIIREESRKSNGLGTAGFVLALLALLGCWIPVLNWILWLLGFIFSFIGIFKSPRGLAIAGLCISLVDLIPLILLLGIRSRLTNLIINKLLQISDLF